MNLEGYKNNFKGLKFILVEEKKFLETYEAYSENRFFHLKFHVQKFSGKK